MSVPGGPRQRVQDTQGLDCFLRWRRRFLILVYGAAKVLDHTGNLIVATEREHLDFPILVLDLSQSTVVGQPHFGHANDAVSPRDLQPLSQRQWKPTVQ